MNIIFNPDLYPYVLLANLVVTAMMTGVIWLVQLVHYPLFEGIDRTQLVKWHAFHSSRISWIVGPLMVAELILCVPLLTLSRTGPAFLIVALTLLIWLGTFFISVPLHNQIAAGKNPDLLIKRLVFTNWMRTALYSVKLISLICLMAPF